MIIKDPKNYALLKFARSKTRGKKYDAILRNKRTLREKRVPFGAIGYEQYRDSTGLGLDPTTAIQNGARITGPATPERMRANSAAAISAGNTYGSIEASSSSPSAASPG